MKKLAIIGASYLQLPLIFKAREQGLETHVFAWEEGAVGKDHCDHFYPVSIIEKEEILKICRKIKIDGILSIASDLAIVTVNFIAEKLGLTGNSSESAIISTNKYLMRECLMKYNLPCPQFYKVTGAEQIRSDIPLPVIVKPTDRSGSRGVTRVDRQEDLAPAVDRALSESLVKEAIIESFMQGREISVEMISWQGVHEFLACTDKVTSGLPYFVELQHHQPANLDPEHQSRIIKAVRKALDALKVRYGASHSEVMIHDDNSFSIVEIGARMGGDHIGAELVQLSTGFDFLSGVIDIALGVKPEISTGVQKYAGIYYITPEQGIVTGIADRSKEIPSVVQSNIYVKAGDRVVYPVRESQHRSAYFIYQADRKTLFDDLTKVIKIKTRKQ